MAIPKRAAAIAVLIALAASGCTQPDPNAKPTYACTPSEGGTPHPCYKAEHDLQAKEDALYAEAEAVYRKYRTEHERIYRVGGAKQATPTMLETLTGDALQERTAHYRGLLESSVRATGGTFLLGYLRRAPKEKAEGSIATLESCIDARSVRITEGKTSHPGKIGLERAFFTQSDSGLKISYLMRFDGEVASCV